MKWLLKFQKKGVKMITADEFIKSEKLNPAQEAAAITSNGEFLVSASAGSGKTKVLSSRATKLILEGTPVEKLLILTFTKEAAKQMAERIKKLLIKVDNLEAASKVDLAHIETFDSFCLAMVRRYHNLLNLDANVTILDKGILEIETSRLIQEIFDEFYKKQDERFLNFITQFSSKDDENIKNKIIRKLFKKFEIIPDTEKYINNYFLNFYDENKFIKSLDNYYEEIMDKLKTLKYEYDINNYELNDKIYDTFMIALSCRDYDDLVALNDFNFGRVKGDDASKDFHSRLKTVLEYIKDHNDYSESHHFVSKEKMLLSYRNSKKHIEIVLEIIKELHRRLLDFKKRNNAFDFIDIAKYLIKLLKENDSVRKEISSMFDYIMIDEYQDTSDLQEETINLIKNNNVFQVGDIKQSIYRFRNANPDLFLEKMNKFNNNEGGKTHILKTNYRPTVEVIDAINLFFAKVMKPPHQEYDYNDGHAMEPLEGKCGVDKGMQVISYSASEIKENIDKDEFEVTYIALDILRRIKESNNSLNFSNFTILIDRANKFNFIKKIFDKYSIPLSIEREDNVEMDDIYFVIKNILKLIFYIHDDNKKMEFDHSFISILRSFIYEISDEELANLAENKDYSSYDLYKIIDRLNLEKDNLSIRDLIFSIYEQFDIYKNLLKIDNYDFNLAILDRILSLAISYDELGQSALDLLNYFIDADEYEVSMKIRVKEDIENCVKLMTIHGSKGLEFDYIYLPFNNVLPNLEDARSSILFDQKLGMFIPSYDFGDIGSPFRDQLSDKINSELAMERLRLLYVGLTRAKKQNIVLLPLPNLNNKKKISNVLKENCSTFSNFYYYGLMDEDYSFLDYPEVINANFETLMRMNDLITNNVNDLKDEKETVKTTLEIKPCVNLNLLKPLKRIRASKAESSIADEDLLNFGTRLHAYLEKIDFKNVDLSFIQDEKERKMIDRFLKLDIFKNAKNARALHEFSYYDEEEDVSGFIDLILIYDEHIDIIDFKLSHIDDPNYARQLGMYKHYLEKINNKKLTIKTYLTSIIKGTCKEVKSYEDGVNK